MILDRVTLTGADDSVAPDQLVPLSRQYPFVEWGILYSGSRQNVPRYPSENWIARLNEVRKMHPLKLSAHLCGKWVRDLVLHGTFTWAARNGDVAPAFQRIQLNFHAHHHPGSDAFLAALRAVKDKEFIFQMDEVNDSLWQSAHRADLPAVPLFDTSGGAGILPHSWPRSYANVYCGYAGGLGPDNVVEQLRAVATVAIGAVPVWIDMETRVRSDGDAVFDLDKCRAVLEQCAPFVGKML